MATQTDVCVGGHASSVNAQLCAFLQQHYPCTVANLSLESLRRYPLPVLTAASAADVAGLAPVRPQPAVSSDSPVTLLSADDGLHSAAGVVHRFWQMSDASFLLESCHTTGGGTSASHTVSSPSGREGRHARAGAKWLAQSPFRACAQPSFHAQLRRCATLPPASTLQVYHAASPTHAPCQGEWSRMDALCHGFSGAVDGAPPCRKRLRAASAVTATQPLERQTANYDRVDGVLSSNDTFPTATRDVRNTNTLGRAVQGGERCAGSPALQSRVTENDALLSMLLGEPATPPAVTGENRNERAADGGIKSHNEGSRADGDHRPPSPFNVPQKDEAAAHVPHTQDHAVLSHLPAVAAASQVTADVGEDLRVHRSVPPSDNRIGLASRTVKELKETCARLGLLSTGSKPVLIQRIQLYQSSIKEAKGTATSPPSPPPLEGQGGVQPVHTTVFSMLLSRRTASGSPPRTIFRYRSPLAPQDVSTVTAAAAVPPTVAVTTGKTSGYTPPHLELSTVATGVDVTTSTISGAEALPSTPACTSRRVVPSPTTFLQQLVAAHSPQRLQQGSASPLAACSVCATAHASRCMCGERAAPPLASPAALRAHEEALKSEMHTVRWQWLVDFRERAGAQRGSRSKHEGMVDAFRRQKVPCASVTLPSGDFMLAVDLSPQEAAELQHAHQHGPSHTAVQTGGGAGEVGIATGIVLAEPLRVFGHVCSLVVERKTAADLDASVKGSRYTEQRRLLAASPYALVVWLIEGADVGGGGRDESRFVCRTPPYPRQGGSRKASPTPAPDGSDASTASDWGRAASPASPSSLAVSAQQRVDSACASLGLQQRGWLVVRTRNTAESVQFLQRLALQVVWQLARRRLSYRETPAESRGALRIVTKAMDPVDAGVAAHLGSLFRYLTPPRISAPSLCGSSACVHDSCHSALLQFAPTEDCLQSVSALQRRLRMQTAFPRMLMCVRGCSPTLAALLSNKYGSLMGFWRALCRRGRAACDADPDIRRLSTAQKKVFILLTEFLLARDYY